MNGLNRLLRILGPLRARYFWTTLLLTGIFSLERLVMAGIFRWFTDALQRGNMPQLWATVCSALIFYLVYTATIPVLYRPWLGAIYRALSALRHQLFDQLQRLPLAYHERHHTGDALSVMSNDIAVIEDAYRTYIWDVAESLFTGVASAVFMLILDWRLALLSFGCGLAVAGLNLAVTGPLRGIGRQAQARLGVLAERATDLIGGFEFYRSFSLGHWVIRRFGSANTDARDTALMRVEMESRVSAVNALTSVILLLPVLVGALWALSGRITLGTIFGMLQLSNGFMLLLTSLGTSLAKLQGSLAAAERVDAVLDTPREPETCGDASVAPITADATKGITLSDVVFGYDDSAPVLNGLSLSVDAGSVVAVVGPSGSGKSTLFKLLLGFYRARSGDIRVAGHPLNDYRLHDLRKLFAFVPQDAYLYAGTIEENIRFGRPTAAEADVVAAARAANADGFIRQLPGAYHTSVGDRGSRLSGGQRQRIAIARALLKDAPFLLLDEATSALDSESEHLVQEALGRLMLGRTTLVIAHRLSTIEKADQICVVADGRVVEQGRHEQLLASDGVYRRLSQAGKAGGSLL